MEGTDEAAEHFADAFDISEDGGSGWHEVETFGKKEVSFEFTEASLSLAEILDEFYCAFAAPAFGDIGGYGSGGTTDLAGEPEHLGFGKRRGQSVCLEREIHALLPNLQIFKRTDWWHQASRMQTSVPFKGELLLYFFPVSLRRNVAKSLSFGPVQEAKFAGGHAEFAFEGDAEVFNVGEAAAGGELAEGGRRHGGRL